MALIVILGASIKMVNHSHAHPLTADCNAACVVITDNNSTHFTTDNISNIKSLRSSNYGKRIYISGPMQYHINNNRDAFIAAEKALLTVGYSVLSPLANDDLPNSAEQPWEWYLKNDLKMVIISDGVAMLDGWEFSRGAYLEKYVADAIRVPVKPLDFWLRS